MEHRQSPHPLLGGGDSAGAHPFPLQSVGVFKTSRRTIVLGRVQQRKRACMGWAEVSVAQCRPAWLGQGGQVAEQGAKVKDS